MIRALLSGSKTQTRRTIKPQPECGFIVGGPGSPACPYGGPGELLWVRETWAQNANQLSDTRMDTRVVYRADGGDRAADNGVDLPWRPSIFMPRRHSRITLPITDVRVQRLQEISESDAQAEGSERIAVTFRREIDGSKKMHPSMGGPYRDGYRCLWESINGAGSWADNPWVWALSFTVIQKNVDEVITNA